MPDSKLTPVITVDVNAAVKSAADSKAITAKVQPAEEKASDQPTAPVSDPTTPVAPVTAVVVAPKKKVAKAKVKPKPKAKAKPKTKAKVKPKAKVKAKKATVKSPKAVRVPKTTPKAKTEGSYLHFGEYSIHVRKDSAYSHVYRILAQESKFDSTCQLLEAFDSNDEKACVQLLRGIFIERDLFEKKLRADEQFVAYCKNKTDRIKEQASRGIAEAKALLKNEKRFSNGIWCGNIREMLSVCCGSMSPEADNRNMKKYANAKVSFRQFPRISKGHGKVYLSMFPSKYALKVNKAIKIVFGDEKRAGFADYLETKLKQVFGT